MDGAAFNMVVPHKPQHVALGVGLAIKVHILHRDLQGVGAGGQQRNPSAWQTNPRPPCWHISPMSIWPPS